MDPAQQIELSALARQKPMNDVIDRGDSDVQKFYAGATIFVTGGSGFIGKQLIEKLFRSCAIRKLYLVMRPKREKAVQERLNTILKDPVYDVLRLKQPQFAERIVCMEGNVADVRLGLSDEHWSTLAKEVNIIFHVAATVRFDEPLRKATLTNVRSTREALELARNCMNLKKFVYVSTAFAFATEDRVNKEILEQFYPCPVSPRTMIALAEDIEESRLDDITRDLIKGWPNTYTFTKSIAEELIRTTAGDLPVCIVRPPIVLATYYEPAPGWIDIRAIAGPSGLYIGGGLGLIHVLCTDVDNEISIAPVDYVNNVIITSAWDSTERKKNGDSKITIYNISKNMKFGLVAQTLRSERMNLSSPKSIWRCDTIELKSKLLYILLSWFLHYIPAYILDFGCFLTGKKPQEISSFVGVYTKLDKLVEVYNFFMKNSFNFRDYNVKAMIEKMSDADRAIFNCDLTNIDIQDFIKVWGIGLRKYIVKDGLRGTAGAYRKQQIFLLLTYIILILYVIILFWICATIYSLGKYILF